MINPRILLVYEYCKLDPPEDADGIFIEYSQYEDSYKIRPYSLEKLDISESFLLSEKSVDLMKLVGILKILAKYEAKVVEDGDGKFKVYSMDHREIKSLRICIPICELQIEFIDNVEYYNFEGLCSEALISKWRVV